MTALKELVLPESLESIGKYAFYKCNQMTTYDLPAGLTSIGEYAFYQNTALQSMVIPDGVTELKKYTFYSQTIASHLVSVSGKGVKTIGDECFDACSALENVDFPQLESVGKNAFLNCTSLKDTASFENLKTIGIRRKKCIFGLHKAYGREASRFFDKHFKRRIPKDSNDFVLP